MKNYIKLPLMLFCAFVLLVSCSKYEDGPMFSIYTKTERVVGFWRFDFVAENGVDKTEEYVQQSIELLRNGSLYRITGYRQNNPSFPIIESGAWRFGNNKESIIMVFNPGRPEQYEYDWNIRRLAYGDLRLERYDGTLRFIEWRLWRR